MFVVDADTSNSHLLVGREPGYGNGPEETKHSVTLPSLLSGGGARATANGSGPFCGYFGPDRPPTYDIPNGRVRGLRPGAHGVGAPRFRRGWRGGTRLARTLGGG